jgi:predicted ABC-type ATPase
MQKTKRLRVFAGPNGSGKTTLFNEVNEYFNQLPFVNADEIEYALAKTGLIDLNLFEITATAHDLKIFSKTIDANSLINKAAKEGQTVNFQKIASRYTSTLKNLYPAIKICDRVFLFDNSGKKHELIGEIFSDSLQIKTDQLPNWFLQYVLAHYS